MKSVVTIVVFAGLLIINVQGQRNSVKRCLCQGPGMNRVAIQRIEKIEVYPPSPSCDNLEIIVRLKNGSGKKCLNPESNFAKNYINRAIKKRSGN